MIRVLLFVLLVFALGLGFAWLAERPGELVLTFGGYRYEVTVMVAAVMVTAIVAAVMILWWLVKALWNSPRTVARYFRVRRRDRGYQALSTGMIAAGAGDAGLARRKKKEALRLINADHEPLLHLLDAQASLLEGDHESARKKFEAMLQDPEMRVLGLRGLYLEAERLGDRTAARHYAERAAELAPQLPWAANATIEARAGAGDWDGALALLDAQKATRQIPPAQAARRRAVLLTAKARELIDRDAAAARVAAVEANRLAPDLVPAAIVAARALFRTGDLRKGSKILEAAWRRNAHPEIAETYVHARHGDSVGDRLARARKLQSQRQNNAESAFAVARAALEAGDLALARGAAEESIRIGPREGGFLLMADIEEADTGDLGRIRQWLARAVRAPRDPAWVADGAVSERWEPLSPVTGRLDAFEWRPPVERPLLIADAADLAPPAPAAILPPRQPEPAAQPAGAPQEDAAAEVVEPEAVEAEPAVSAAEAAPAEEPALPPRLPPEPPANDDQESEARRDPAAMPRPDDPGVAPREEAEAPARRFRLF